MKAVPGVLAKPSSGVRPVRSDGGAAAGHQPNPWYDKIVRDSLPATAKCQAETTRNLERL
jgi:hypothetical protein